MPDFEYGIKWIPDEGEIWYEPGYDNAESARAEIEQYTYLTGHAIVVRRPKDNWEEVEN